VLTSAGFFYIFCPMKLEDAVIQRLHEVYAKASKTWPNVAFPFPRIRWDLKGGSAGSAYYLANLIRFNRTLMVENGTDFVNDTPGHEASHLIAWRIYGTLIRPHGAEWQHVMRTIGQTPERCHKFSVTTGRYKYICKCREHYLSTRNHNAILRGMRRACIHCGSIVSWAKLVDNTVAA
jgi:SprT protein